MTGHGLKWRNISFIYVEGGISHHYNFGGNILNGGHNALSFCQLVPRGPLRDLDSFADASASINGKWAGIFAGSKL
jgi:hypothetical protein